MNQVITDRIAYLEKAAAVAQSEGCTATVEPADILLLTELAKGLQRDNEELHATVDRMVSARHSEAAHER